MSSDNRVPSKLREHLRELSEKPKMAEEFMEFLIENLQECSGRIKKLEWFGKILDDVNFVHSKDTSSFGVTTEKQAEKSMSHSHGTKLSRRAGEKLVQAAMLAAEQVEIRNVMLEKLEKKIKKLKAKNNKLKQENVLTHKKYCEELWKKHQDLCGLLTDLVKINVEVLKRGKEENGSCCQNDQMNRKEGTDASIQVCIEDENTSYLAALKAELKEVKKQLQEVKEENETLHRNKRKLEEQESVRCHSDTRGPLDIDYKPNRKKVKQEKKETKRQLFNPLQFLD